MVSIPTRPDAGASVRALHDATEVGEAQERSVDLSQQSVPVRPQLLVGKQEDLVDGVAVAKLVEEEAGQEAALVEVARPGAAAILGARFQRRHAGGPTNETRHDTPRSIVPRRSLLGDHTCR